MCLCFRDAALRNSDQKIKNLEAKLDSHTVKYQSEKDALELKLRDLEEMWHGKL